jgi:hypothetical protein
MTRTVELCFQVRNRGMQRVKITPAWAGKGIAIHKPIAFDPDTREPYFQEIQGLWNLTHIATGMAMGACIGSLDRAKGFARQWDAEFAALQPGEAMAPDRLQAWAAVVEEMKTEPPRKPRQPVVRRGREVAA